MSIKQKVLEHCHAYVKEKEERLLSRYKLLQESLNNETKSTAGDKHETGRAMVQLEQEKLGKQQKELQLLKQILKRVEVDKPTSNVSLGSLVKTDTHSYFLAIFANVFESKDEHIFCISAASPIGQCLLGKTVGESFFFNGKTVSILEVQ